MKTEEHRRLAQDAARTKNWKRWGPYLAERQWGTVREDYSPDGEAWEAFSHEQARSRAYRWGEDGLLGICDRQCRLCLAPALWNGEDRILKERLFGLTGPQGNHGEDVKEEYYYLDATPTGSYLKALYKYPQAAFPYEALVEENARRGLNDREFELVDTGAFDENRYFDLVIECAKADDNDLLIRYTLTNRGSDSATAHLLPTVWFRNRWSFGGAHEQAKELPFIRMAEANEGTGSLTLHEESLGDFSLTAYPQPERWLFCDNETNAERLFGASNHSHYPKDAFHDLLVEGDAAAVNPVEIGTKAAGLYRFDLASGESASVVIRLRQGSAAPASAWDDIAAKRIAEADAFYADVIPANLPPGDVAIARQAYAGLVWGKQFYHFIVQDWLAGDRAVPLPAKIEKARREVRNGEWEHLYARDILSMPDTWEYPWFAAWDLAFHMLPFARIDPDFAKSQLLTFLREWYLHPNGMLPAYEWNFSDVNPPVHAWAVWRVYKMTGERGYRDRDFLGRCFQKLLLNFTWWVNRKDANGNNLFEGGFLGLDNIGVFDRSEHIPGGGTLQQADATAWMGFFSLTMLAMSLELAIEGDHVDVAYADMASKFFEHFIQICDAMNAAGGCGLWDEADGFYYDQLHVPGKPTQIMRIRSLVGLLPLAAVEVLDSRVIDRLPGFRKRFDWFLENRKDLAQHISWTRSACADGIERWLLALPSKERLERILSALLDEDEFLSPHGIRSLSKHHEGRPFAYGGGSVAYTPGESDTWLFGGNSNWRGPIWFPTHYLLAEALERYHLFYGDDFKVECPTGSGNLCTLQEVACELHRRAVSLFQADADGRRPCHAEDSRYAENPGYQDLILFYEYFEGDTGRGLGANHQTGWTALVARCLEKVYAGEVTAECSGEES